VGLSINAFRNINLLLNFVFNARVWRRGLLWKVMRDVEKVSKNLQIRTISNGLGAQIMCLSTLNTNASKNQIKPIANLPKIFTPLHQQNPQIHPISLL
jgi:hypothetical protein